MLAYFHDSGITIGHNVIQSTKLCLYLRALLHFTNCARKLNAVLHFTLSANISSIVCKDCRTDKQSCRGNGRVQKISVLFKNISLIEISTIVPLSYENLNGHLLDIYTGMVSAQVYK